jgi:hypothetical protein
MSNIKTLRRKNKTSNTINTYYCAKDVSEAAGIIWHTRKLESGIDTSEVAEHMIQYKSESGKNCNAKQVFLTEKGVSQFCKKYGAENPIAPKKVTKPTSSDSAISEARINQLEQLVSSLKTMVATLAVKNNNESSGKIELTTTAPAAKVDLTQLVNQATARKATRQLCEAYADAWAKKEGKTKIEDKKQYFDYTWNELYKQFNKSHSIDLKNIAKERSNKTGTKVSALSVAETDGHAVDLLNLAKQLYQA